MALTVQAAPIDVLVLNTGRVYLDILFGNVDRLPEAGEEIHYDSFSIQAGGAFNTAAGCALLGLNTALVADLGSDALSEFLFAETRRVGIRHDFIARNDGPLAAVSVSATNRHDRRFLSYVRPMDDTRLDPSVFDRVQVRHLHMPGYRHNADYLDVLEAAKKRGCTISLDSQSDAGTLRAGALPQMLPLLDVLFCNRTEAMALTGKGGGEAALRELARHCAMPVVKLGADGAMTMEGDRIVKAPGHAVEVVDTTGAGDSFGAGFLWARLHGMPVKDALAAGNFCGALCTTKLGAMAAFPGEARLRALMEGRETLEAAS